jgi:hypothetical protein
MPPPFSYVLLHGVVRQRGPLRPPNLSREPRHRVRDGHLLGYHSQKTPSMATVLTETVTPIGPMKRKS